jgi:hypothetical protein
VIKTDITLLNQSVTCPYSMSDNKELQQQLAWKIYSFMREAISRVLPFVILAYFNIQILYAYRRTKQDRLTRINEFQRSNVSTRTEIEERRLWLLLVTILTLFFFCTIPAAPVTIFVSDGLKCNINFQRFRTSTNLMEFTKFALNFYLYCMINPDIRKLCSHKIRCRTFHQRVPMEHSRTDIRSLTRLLQAADTLSGRRSTLV